MLAVANPLSQEHSHLRTLLLPSLLEALARNASWGRDDLALFEIAHTYHPVEGQTLPREPWTFGAVMRGRLGGAAWRRAGEPASFFLGKGVLESILGAVGVTCRVVAMPATYDPFLHPGRKGFVQVPGEQALGFVGELHPLTARRYGFDDPVVCIELDLDRLCERLGDPPRALPLSEFPPLRQDISVVGRRRAPRQRRARGCARGRRRAAQRRPGLRRLARRRGARPRPALAGAAADVPGAGPHALRRGGAAVPRGHRRAPARGGRSRTAFLGRPSEGASVRPCRLRWPALPPYDAWRATRDTLHAHTQVLGKLAATLAPPEPQLQHAALRLSARGWETAPLPAPDGSGALVVALDLHAYEAIAEHSDGPR